LDISHYTLSPFGSFTHIERTHQILMPFISILLRALLSRHGSPFVLCIRNITGDSLIPLNETEANCAGQTLTEPKFREYDGLSESCKRADEELTFARLTAEAQITFIRSICD